MAVALPRAARAHGTALVLLPLALMAWWAASAPNRLYAVYHVISAYAAQQGMPWLERVMPLALPPGWRPLADSWEPMFRAHAHAATHGTGHIYALFLSEGVRFQYPPLTLLTVGPFAHAGPDAFALYLNVGLAAAHGAVCLLAALLAWDAWRQRVPAAMTGRRSAAALVAAAAAGGTLLFPPLLLATAKGQIQTVLTVVLLAAFAAFQRGATGLAGALLAASCVFKPMLAPTVLWAAIAGRRRMVVAFLITGSALAAASLLLYGFDAHLDYLAVLSRLGSASESVVGNSAPAGLVSRLLGNQLDWVTHRINDPDPFVRGTGIATQAALVILGLRLGGFARWDAPLSLAAAIGAFAVASPVVWRHHYTFLLPLALLSLVTLLARARDSGPAVPWWQVLAWGAGMTLMTLQPATQWLLSLPLPLTMTLPLLPFFGGLCLVALGWSLLAEARGGVREGLQERAAAGAA